MERIQFLKTGLHFKGGCLDRGQGDVTVVMGGSGAVTLVEGIFYT